MRQATVRGGRAGHCATALALALPLAAGAAAALATGGSWAAGDADAALPGFDLRRVVVPRGELAGHAIEVSEVTSHLDPSDALGRVERRWREHDGAEVLRADSGGWAVLSRRTPHGYDTLQLRAAARGGAQGLLTQWREANAGPTSGASLLHLLPDDAHAVRQLRSRDGSAAGAREAETLIGRLPHSIDEAERRIERHLRRAGFVAAPTPGARRQLSWRDDRARFFQAPGVELLVTLHAQSEGTGVVLYHVRATR